MNSEAAYFPDALASTPEALGLGHCAPEISSEPLDEVQSIGNETEEQPAACVIQTPELSDSLLLNRVAQGDKDALSVLFRRHAHVVFSVACRILRDESEAEDLGQEHFLFFFKKAGLFDAGKSSGASWIIQMAYQRALDRRRYLDVRHHYSVQEFDEERSASTKGQISTDQIAGRALLDTRALKRSESPLISGRAPRSTAVRSWK